MRRENIIGVVAAALVLVQPVSVLASAVNDLEGARAAGALEDMDRRGYVQTSSYRADGGSYTYWWNRDKKSCVRLLTRDGKIAATKTSTAPDCGQKASGGGGDAAAAVIAGAAILAGVAALSHKSHHRDDQEYNDSQGYAEFERGHRDGLYAHPYHNYSNSDQYRRGYDSGVRERGHQTSYRSDNGRRGGYRAHVNLADLVYQDKRWAEGQLGSRGFSRTGSYERPDGGHSSSWWNGRTKQCVNVNSRSSKIEAVEEINEGNCQ